MCSERTRVSPAVEKMTVAYVTTKVLPASMHRPAGLQRTAEKDSIRHPGSEIHSFHCEIASLSNSFQAI